MVEYYLNTKKSYISFLQWFNLHNPDIKEDHQYLIKLDNMWDNPIDNINWFISIKNYNEILNKWFYNNKLWIEYVNNTQIHRTYMYIEQRKIYNSIKMT